MAKTQFLPLPTNPYGVPLQKSPLHHPLLPLALNTPNARIPPFPSPQTTARFSSLTDAFPI